jgi:glycosyltransferase involved in cell wall biosynthesis
MLAQDYENLEVVISDNASTDGTRSFCEDLARRDARVRYRRQSRNIGSIKNYGQVLRLATGELYMNLADDDDLELSYVSKCVDALEADRGLSVVCGRSLMYMHGEFQRESTRTNLLDESPCKRVLSYYETVTDNGAFHGVIRRTQASALPPMRDGVMGGDWLFVASMAFSGRIKTIDDVSIVKHMGGPSISMESIARVLGLSRQHGTYAFEYIIVAVFCDIAWESPVYAPLGPQGRLRLAASAAMVLARRFGQRKRTIAFLRMTLTDALLPARLKRKLVSLRDALTGLP